MKLGRAELVDATAQVRAQAAAQEARLEALEAALASSEHAPAIRVRIEETRRLLAQRVAAFELIALRALATLERQENGGPCVPTENSERDMTIRWQGQRSQSDRLNHDEAE